MNASELLDRLISASVGFSLAYITRLHELSLKPMHVDIDQEEDAVRMIPDIQGADTAWAGAAVVEGLRSMIDSYLHVIRRLRKERRDRANKKFKVKDHFKDLDFDKMIQDECSRRVSREFVLGYFKSLDLTGKKISSLDEGMSAYGALEELFVSSCSLSSLGMISPKVKILCAEDNNIKSLDTLTTAHQLAHLGLALNELTSASLGALCVLPALHSLDLSYNRLSDLVEVCDTLGRIKTLRKLSLLGNPCALVVGYRGYILSRLALETLDDVPCELASSVAGTPVPPSASNSASNSAVVPSVPAANFQLEICVDKIVGVAVLLGSDAIDRPTTTGKAAAKPPAKGKGAKDVPETVSAPRRCVYLSLESDDIAPGVRISSGEVDIANCLGAPPADSDSKPLPKGAKKPDAPTPTSSNGNDLMLNYKAVGTVPLQEDVAVAFLRPVPVRIFVTERQLNTAGVDPPVTPVPGNAPSPTSVTSKKSDGIPLLLGTFLVNLSCALTGGKSVCKTNIVSNEFYTRHRQALLAAIQAELEAANVELEAERQRVLKAADADAPVAPAGATAAKAPPKPKAKTGKTDGASIEDEEIAKKQKNVERLQEAVAKEEIEIAKGPPSLTLYLTVEINPVLEVVKAAVEIKDPKAAKKK